MRIDLTAPIEEQAAAMAAACETVGFFTIATSTINLAVAEAAWKSAASFFALPEDEKRKIEFPEAGYPYGYSPYRFESLAKSLDDGTPTGPDLKESLSVGPDCGTAIRQGAPGQDNGEDWIRSPSLWPEHPADLRSSWTAYYQALSHVAEQLMSVMAVALELPADYFASYIDRPITSMRALHYPELHHPELNHPELNDPLLSDEMPTGEHPSLRAGAHSDYGTLTILRTDDVAGLEIQQPDGSWSAVTPQADAFVVNLGDSIAQWTNDRWRSTVHRVSLVEPAARQSFAFFHMANWDATIECLPTCRVDGQEPRHKPVQAGPWLMNKFQATVT